MTSDLRLLPRYLIDQGADVAAVNNEGELPVDLCEEAIEVRDLLRHEIAVRGELYVSPRPE